MMCMHRQTDRSAASRSVGTSLRLAFLLIFVSIGSASGRGQTPAPAWRGVLQDEAGHPVAQAQVKLDAGDDHKTATTAPNGAFVFPSLLAKSYSLSIEANGHISRNSAAITIPAQAAAVTLTLKADGVLFVGIQQEKAAASG